MVEVLLDRSSAVVSDVCACLMGFKKKEKNLFGCQSVERQQESFWIYLTLSRVPVKIVGGAAWADIFWCSSYRCIYACLEALGSLAVYLIIVEA